MLQLAAYCAEQVNCNNSFTGHLFLTKLAFWFQNLSQLVLLSPSLLLTKWIASLEAGLSKCGITSAVLKQNSYWLNHTFIEIRTAEPGLLSQPERHVWLKGESLKEQLQRTKQASSENFHPCTLCLYSERNPALIKVRDIIDFDLQNQKFHILNRLDMISADAWKSCKTITNDFPSKYDVLSWLMPLTLAVLLYKSSLSI